MAKMTKEEVEQVIARDLPGYKVARRSKVEREAEPATRSASPGDLADGGGGGGGAGSDHLAELRRKYLGAADDEEEDDVTGAADTAGSNPGLHNADSADDDDEEIVAVEPEAANHPWDRSARPKAVVVKNKKIIGVQG